jgi:glycosyltransferase involved in cell wall biosynthesis
MRKVKKVVAVSDPIREELTNYGIKKDKVNVIFNGIELKTWCNEKWNDENKFKMRIGLRKESFVLGLFGRLYDQKGHEFLFRSLGILKKDNIELICVGDGPLKARLKKLSEQLGLDQNIHFLGFRNDIKRLLNITDIFVMPSLDEGLPMALLEAMAMGKAIIATPVGAIPNVISHGTNGIIVPTRSISDLADAIKNLISNPERIDILGKSARETAIEKFSSDAMVEQYINLYKDMIRCY